MSTKEIVSHTDVQSAEEIQVFWTPEMFQEAVPETRPDFESSSEELLHESAEEPGYDEPANAAGSETNGDPELESLDVKAGCTGKLVGKPSASKYKCSGRLFYEKKGKPYYCSAGAIHGHVVLTLGFSMYNNLSWAKKNLFMPGYSDPAMKGLKFNCSNALAFNLWTEKRMREYDYAMCPVRTNMTPSIGHWGLLWNANTQSREWFALGYPSRPSPPYPSDGKKMFYTKFHARGMNDNLVQVGNNNFMGGGYGSLWITTSKGKEVYVNGVQAYREGNCISYSPYFNEDVKKLKARTIESALA